MESCLCSLDQDAIKKFQEGKLSENEEEWHRLVDPEARASLDPKEVKRQSVIFEVIKSEKDYVADLEILQNVSILLSRSILPCCIAGYLLVARTGGQCRASANANVLGARGKLTRSTY
jgi:hypothetical protein